MKKEFVSYELAVKLKALGFDEPCFSFYQREYAEVIPVMVDDNEQYKLTGFRTCKNSEIPEHYVSAPTFSQCFRWFREKYGMYSHIKTSGKISVLEFTWVSNGKYGFFSKDGFKTYEEAELSCLNKLIEIVESSDNTEGSVCKHEETYTAVRHESGMTLYRCKKCNAKV